MINITKSIPKASNISKCRPSKYRRLYCLTRKAFCYWIPLSVDEVQVSKLLHSNVLSTNRSALGRSTVIIYFFHVLFDCNLFKINISYGFGDIKAINLLCQQPSAQLIITLNAKHYIVEVHTKSIYFWRQWKKRSFSNWPCSVPEECVD